MSELSDLSETDASNTIFTSIDISEGCNPSNVNNWMRAISGALRRWFKTSLFRLRDSADQTKLLAFDLSGVSTGTTRTLIAPNLSGTITTSELFDATDYTVAWTASSGTPSIGNGALSGRYMRIGNYVHVTINLFIGSTTTFGTGSWFFGLPIQTAAAKGPSIVEAVALDSSASTYYRGAGRASAGTSGISVTSSSSAVLWGPTTPFTFASGDLINFEVRYWVD